MYSSKENGCEFFIYKHDGLAFQSDVDLHLQGYNDELNDAVKASVFVL